MRTLSRTKRTEPTETTAKPFPFERLPSELRLQIYRKLLVRPEPIDLWPHIRYNMMYNCNLQRATVMREYQSTNRPRVALLRVSKLIHEEASEVFYGENEWRFSGINGWMVMSCWLNTIQFRHFRFLKTVTVHVPFLGKDYVAFPTYGTVDFHERICAPHPRFSISRGERHRVADQTMYFRARLRRFGFSVPTNWSHNESLQDCLNKLKTTALCHFTLQYLDNFQNTLMIHREAEHLRAPKFSFVFLKHRSYGMDDESRGIMRPLQPWLRRYTGECKKMVELVKKREWEIGYGIVHAKGGWSVISRDECEVICGDRALEREERDENDWINY
ncbi:hypothetical protein P153DRAFT_400995 [Dothidotthia symphoricarpi CBS 119687]|uniref:F-box domain-containing protein n=1 Tax=Dothidotthia symphoricarpi CBS 119687 TaxID=1392245 RepID=A0A6A5ZYJ4_9PLEO|nr:uncharacterized protein P153DRAFT_400995 [Dothidotthia symphoricarpi CBS 119687]KAF2124366.1 hypothetical protein P153DRAFT_400995 [Dothidotthia symphoricarpi CBS 119687]